MFRAYERGGEDGLLHHHETDIGNLQCGFLPDFPDQCRFAAFAALDFSAGNAPQVAPFMGADHQRFSPPVVDQGTDRGDGALRLPLFKHPYQHPEIGHRDVRPDRRENLRMVVSGEHCDGGNTAVARGLDVMRHVPDKGGFPAIQRMCLDDEIDQLPFVEDARVGLFEEILHAEFVELPEKRIRIHRGENKHPHSARARPFQLLPRVGQHGHRADRRVERRAEMRFQLLQGNAGQDLRVELAVGQPEAAPETLAVVGRDAVFPEHGVRRLDHRPHVVHQSA